MVTEKGLPYECTIAGTIRQAQELLEANSYDIIIADYNLTDGTALEIIDSINNTPVILVTGMGDEELAVKTWRMGAYDYLIKDAARNYLQAIPITISNAVLHYKTQEKLKLLSAAVSSMKDNVYITDLADKIIFVNKSFCETYGYEEQEIIGRESRILWKQNKQNAEGREIYKAVNGWTLAFYHKQKDGTEFPVSLSKSPVTLENGKELAIVHIVHDIRDNKLTEKRQAELTDEIESANNKLTDFANIVSHDLKTPLRGISTIAEWLCSNYGEKLGDDGKKQIELLASRVAWMHNLIEGVLQYSRLGRVKGQEIEVDLNSLLPEIIKILNAPDNIRITIEDELPELVCDDTKIIQVFQNLLSNAINGIDKKDGLVNIRCSEENGYWKFAVADNGCGIEKREFERIFKIFQTSRNQEDHESTGVGLTVAKKIIELYGGRIWVESEIAKGSTFYFTFPLRKDSTIKHQTRETAYST